MRQLLLLSFALLPVAAHAQMTSVAPAPNLTATANAPRVAISATHLVAADVPTRSITTDQHISLIVSPDFVPRKDGSLSSTFGKPNSVQNPKLAKFASITIAQADLAKQAPETTLSVGLRVDTTGVPQSLHIERSSGDAAIDADALVSINQFRFKPAMVSNAAVESGVTLNVTIDKK